LCDRQAAKGSRNWGFGLSPLKNPAFFLKITEGIEGRKATPTTVAFIATVDDDDDRKVSSTLSIVGQEETILP
jgi:hypothetical protein